GHESPIATASWSPDGLRLVTASPDGTARIWAAKTGAQLRVLTTRDWWPGAGPEPGRDEMSKILQQLLFAAFSPDGSMVVTSGADSVVRVWGSRTGEPVAALKGPVSTAPAWSPDGARIMTGGADGAVRICEAKTGVELAVLKG